MRSSWISSAWSLSKNCCMVRTGSTRLANNRGGTNMRNRFIVTTSGMVLALSLTALPATAQATKTAATSALPRTPDAHPDLQGTYDLATMTPFERLPGDGPVLTKEQAQKLQDDEMVRRSKDATKLDPNRPHAAVGGDRSPVGTSYFERLERAGGG